MNEINKMSGTIGRGDGDWAKMAAIYISVGVAIFAPTVATSLMARVVCLIFHVSLGDITLERRGWSWMLFLVASVCWVIIGTVIALAG